MIRIASEEKSLFLKEGRKAMNSIKHVLMGLGVSIVLSGCVFSASMHFGVPLRQRVAELCAAVDAESHEPSSDIVSSERFQVAIACLPELGVHPIQKMKAFFCSTLVTELDAKYVFRMFCENNQAFLNEVCTSMADDKLRVYVSLIHEFFPVGNAIYDRMVGPVVDADGYYDEERDGDVDADEGDSPAVGGGGEGVHAGGAVVVHHGVGADDDSDALFSDDEDPRYYRGYIDFMNNQ